MKRTRRWLLIPIALLAVAVTQADAVAPFKKVSIATTPKSASSASSTDATATGDAAHETPVDEAKHENTTSTAHPTKNSKLTGIPQIDYIWDPNLPRELRGYNLSNYPFHSTVPPEEDIHFKCDGLHDGFYASIEHKCQVYHHCVYGIRHDFLCANFTAFDQKTFICHFVSDVDCEGSQKYWNRNDDLYMATTTTSTTTTTTEPPPTQRRRNPVRPIRPLRRPSNRRPTDDYYYDDEEYDEDYYEERLNRKRKQRPRQRKPILEYDDEYEEKRSFGEEDARPARRPSSRDRFRDEDELEEYDNPRRKYDRSKGRSKPTAASATANRRKSSDRKPGTIGSRGSSADERRSFNDDRPVKEKPGRPSAADEAADVTASETQPRRSAGRNRLNEKRSTSPAPVSDDDLEGDAIADQDHEAANDEASPKVRTTPKPLEEFVTPKAASSVFSRPRAPPRIARPVPVTEKKKFQYPVQKAGGAATPAPDAAGASADEDYYEDEEYEDVRRHRVGSRRRVPADEAANKFVDDEDEVPVVAPVARRRQHKNPSPVGVAKKAGSRSSLRKPVIEKKPLPAADEDYDTSGSASNERYDTSRGAARGRRPHRNYAGRGADDVDFVDEDYEERPSRPAHRLRPKAGGGGRKHVKKVYKPPVEPVEDELVDEELVDESVEPVEPAPRVPLRSRTAAGIRHRPAAAAGGRRTTASTKATTKAHRDEVLDDELAEEPEIAAHEPEDADEPEPVPVRPKAAAAGRPSSVRVVKRPFLPSRGGSPYLPRGLQPVGVASGVAGAPLKGAAPKAVAHTTDSTPLDMGSTISGVRLLEHGAPIVRNSLQLQQPLPTAASAAVRDSLPHLQQALQQQQQHMQQHERQQHEQQRHENEQQQQQQHHDHHDHRISLDELYENDYDVTLNDALNPTLKPLSAHPPHPSSASSASYHVRSYAVGGGDYGQASAPAAKANSFVNNQSNSNSNSQQATYSNSNYYNNNNNHNNNQQHQHHPNNNNYQHQSASASSSAYLSSPSASSASSVASLSSSLSSASAPASHPHSINQQGGSHNPHPLLLHHHNQQQQPHHQQPATATTSTTSTTNLNNYNSDSYFSSTDIRRRAVIPAPASDRPSRSGVYANTNRGVGLRIAQHFYDDFEY